MDTNTALQLSDVTPFNARASKVNVYDFRVTGNGTLKLKESFVGRHLLVEGLGSDKLLSDETALRNMFDDLVVRLEMEYLSPPVFHKVELNPDVIGGPVFHDDGGVTGVAVITTSHLSIHTWPLRHFFTMDVYSCKNFDVPKAIVALQDAGLVELKVTDITRKY